MNLLTVLLRFLFVLAVFGNCLCDVPSNTTSSDDLQSSKLLSNLIGENDNTVDSALQNDSAIQNAAENSTSGDPQSDHLLANSIKKSIDSKLIDEPFNALEAVDKFAVTCNETTEYLCKSGDKCIDNALLCDGFKDCPLLGDDEANCDHNCTQQNKFECKSDGKCIDMISRCNDFKDCADGSDELDCYPITDDTCTADEFRCSSGQCIHKNKQCDRSEDCDDGSDEWFCKYTCAENEFQCKNDLKCIPDVFVCNGRKECSDGSDEENCIHNVANYTCGENEFSCQTEPKKCIPLENVCDGIDHCGNNQDEPNECDMDLCKNHHCAHECKQERHIAKCVCRPGFKLSANGVDCEDINECLEVPSFCSGHECINLNGSATCNCANGYRFNDDEKRCKVINGRNATIVYSNQNELRNTSLSIKSYLASQLLNANEPSINGVIRQNLAAVGMFVFDFADNYLIWHDMNERRLFIAALDENRRPAERNEFWTRFPLPQPHHRMPRTPLKRNQHYVLVENITNVEGMAIDYVHDLLYWSDSDRNVIEVASVRDPSKRKVLVDTDLDEPKGIALNVEEGFLLFTDWGSKRIEYMRTDGTGRRTILDKDLEWPYSIALDPQLNKAYFVDTKKNTLNVVDLDGQNHKVLLTNPMYLERANDLDVFEDRIYFCDQESESILSVDKFNPKTTLKVLVKDLKNALSCKIVHYSKQRSTVDDRCAQSDCEFLCLPRNDLKSHVCACPSSSTLNSDKRTCSVVQPPTLRGEPKETRESLREELQKANANVIYILALAAVAILLVTVVCSYLVYTYAIKRAYKLKFSNNAQYQKTPQQDVKLPSVMEPLNPASNQFV